MCWKRHRAKGAARGRKRQKTKSERLLSEVQALRARAEAAEAGANPPVDTSTLEAELLKAKTQADAAAKEILQHLAALKTANAATASSKEQAEEDTQVDVPVRTRVGRRCEDHSESQFPSS